MISVPDRSSLLLEAFVLPPAQALGKWKSWRETLDPNSLDTVYFGILPMLSHRLEAWLTGDPARQSILGICKRVWTQNQLAFRSLVAIAASLREARVQRIAVSGPAAWALLYAEREAIRPIDSLELLVPRREAAAAVQASARCGWRLLPEYPNPEGATLDLLEGVWLRNARDERLKLGWRLLPSPPELAESREKLGALTSIEIQGVRLSMPAPEEMLLHALAGRRESYQVDWRWDALALLDLRRVDWTRLDQLLAGEITARRRLRELRQQWRVPVPGRILKQETGWFQRRLHAVWRDYQWHAWQAGTPASWAGFAAYCPKRWWKVFVTDRA